MSANTLLNISQLLSCIFPKNIYIKKTTLIKMNNIFYQSNLPFKIVQHIKSTNFTMNKGKVYLNS